MKDWTKALNKKLRNVHLLLRINGLIIIQLTVFSVYGQDDDLADKIQNPVADLVSLPFQNNTDFFNNTSVNTLNIQPVTPFGLGDNINLIARTIIPIVSRNGTTGLGNTILSGFFTPAKPGKVIWGIGPALLFPSGNTQLGGDQFGLAPGAVGLYQSNGWTIGGIAQYFWGISESELGQDLGLFYSQIFIVKGLKGGWYINSAPIITSQNDNWTIPIGAGVGKLFVLGKLPINAQIGYYSYIQHPGDANGQLRAQVVMILPKFY